MCFLKTREIPLALPLPSLPSWSWGRRGGGLKVQEPPEEHEETRMRTKDPMWAEGGRPQAL